MAEDSRVHPEDSDNYLAHPTLLTRSLIPWSLSRPSGAARSYDISSSFSSQASTEHGTDRALNPPALNDVFFNESMLRADNAIPQFIQSVGICTTL